MRVKTIDETQPWRDLGLRIGDLCRSLWFSPPALRSWGERLQRAYRHQPRHSLHANLSIAPSFMRTWHFL